MTRLGKYLEKKSIKKADVSRKTGISQSRLSVLSSSPKTKLTVDELYLISLAIDVSPYDILQDLCKDLKLIKN